MENSIQTAELTLRIGDITFGLTSDDPCLKFAAQGPAQLFVAEEGDPDVRLRVVRKESFPSAAGEKVFDSGPLWQLHGLDGRYVFRFTAPCFGSEPYKTASLDSDFTRGEVCLRADCFQSNSPVYPLEYPLDELLMVHLLAHGRGVEVHGCGVADSDGAGYLFLGQSGAGKTTMARLWKPDQPLPDGRGSEGAREESGGHACSGGNVGADILSDDRIILRFLEGRLWMYGTPWHGEACLASARRTPVDRILFLGRGEKNELAPLARPAAVARLVSCCFPPFHSPAGMEFTLSFLQQVTNAVPCMQLRFVPDRRAVDFVRNAQVRTPLS